MFDELKNSLNPILTTEQLSRIHYLIEIYRFLQVLFPKENGYQWVNSPNKNKLFNGFAPLAFLLSDNPNAIKEVYEVVMGYYENC